jgi:hypothetical protein
MRKYKIKFSASQVRAIVPNGNRRALLLFEVDMGAKAKAWEVIKQLISDRNEQNGELMARVGELEKENADLRSQQNPSPPVEDEADVKAEAELEAFAAAVEAQTAAAKNTVEIENPAEKIG